MTVRTSISLAVAIGGTTLLSPHAVIADTLIAVARQALFSRTLVFTRVATAP
jgi:hypothetical protein